MRQAVSNIIKASRDVFPARGDTQRYTNSDNVANNLLTARAAGIALLKALNRALRVGFELDALATQAAAEDIKSNTDGAQLEKHR